MYIHILYTYIYIYIHIVCIYIYIYICNINGPGRGTAGRQAAARRRPSRGAHPMYVCYIYIYNIIK